MPEEQTKALSLIAAYGFGAEHGLAAEIAEIRSMAIDGMSHPSGVRRGYIAHLFQEKGLLESFIQRHPWGWQPGWSMVSPALPRLVADRANGHRCAILRRCREVPRSRSR